MIISETTKKILTILGYFPFENYPAKVEKYLRKLPCQHIQVWFTFGALAVYAILPLAFYFMKARTFDEYEESKFFILHSIMATPSYISFVVQKNTILRLATKFEELVEKSAYLLIKLNKFDLGLMEM